MLVDAGHDVALLSGAIDPGLVHELDDRMLGALSFTQDETSLASSVTDADHASFLRSFRAWFDTQVARLELDVLYIHNCGRIFDQLDVADLSRQIPVMHTMHDEWFYTDSHYTFATSTGEVVRTYEPRHGEEMLTHSYEHLFDIPSRVGNFVGVGPSLWLTERARRVFPTLEFIHVPNAVDHELFAMQNRADARALLGLPADDPIVLFIGNPTQVRKGFDIYEAALRSMTQSSGINPIRLVAGGSGSVATGGASSKLAPGPLADQLDVPTSNPVRDLGIDGPAIVVADLDRSLMPAVYGAANVLVHPSRIDNLPTVPIEAGLCGTRCLAADVGGTAETIADLDDLFAVDTSTESLGSRIAQALEDSRSEIEADRLARRTTQVNRFASGAHGSAIVEALEKLQRQAVAHG